MEHRFYQLTRTRIEEAVTQLSEKVIAQGRSLTIHVSSDERAKSMDDALWTYSEFLPHSVGEMDGVSQIWITKERQSDAKTQFWLDDFVGEPSQESLICYIFQSVDQDIVAKRRNDWKLQNDKGTFLTYWAQDEHGKWNVVAEANKP